MALATFFDKTALAAATVLHGFDRERFGAALEAQVVGLAFDDAAVRSAEGRTTLTLAMNLAARLYPTLALHARGDDAEAFRTELDAIARAVNPNITLAWGAAAPRTQGAHSPASVRPNPVPYPMVVLIVGETDAAAFGLGIHATVIYLGSSGWEARVSASRPVGSGATDLPFGAAAAACLGAANVFRHVFRAQLPHAALDAALSLSTLSLAVRLGIEPAGAPLLDAGTTTDLGPVDLGEAVLVGAGAVGQGCLWTIVRMRGLQGILHVVDPEAVDPTNPQRYILATSADVGASKVALAEALVRPERDPALGSPSTALPGPSVGEATVAPGLVVRQVASSVRAPLDIVPHPERWGAFLAARPQPWRLARVLVALDSARDRIAVQAALPRWIANAWTQPGDLGLSRHTGLGDSSCLACLYVPNSASAKHEDMLVAEAVGLAGQHMLVRQLLATNAPVDAAIIAHMAAGLGVPAEPLFPFIGRPLRAFYSEAVCGGVVLRLQSEQRAERAKRDAEQAPRSTEPTGDGAARCAAVGGQPIDRAAMVPMVFQSVLAGVLLAAAAVADAAGLPTPPAGQKAVLDILRPVASRLLVPVARHSSGKCLCQDADYQAAFDLQWGASTPSEATAVGMTTAPSTSDGVQAGAERAPTPNGNRPKAVTP